MERIENPIEGVKEWLAEASKLEADANAMSVASVDADGSPTSRIAVSYTHLTLPTICSV